MSGVQDSSYPISWLDSSFGAFEKNLNGGAKSELHKVRVASRDLVKRLGIPSSANEEWRYTSLADFSKVEWTLAVDRSADPAIAESIKDTAGLQLGGAQTELVFIDGYLSQALSSTSTEKGVRLLSLTEALASTDGETAQLVRQHLSKVASSDSDPFVALNSTFVPSGMVLVIERGTEVVAPIHFLYCSTGTADHASYPRLLLLCAESCSCNVVETFVALSDARYLSAPVTEVVVGENARVTHTKVQAESTSAFHIGSLWVDQARSSNFTSNVFHFGGALVRSEINPVMNGEGSECYLNGLTAVGASQHIDNHTVIDHAKPNAFSREIYKGIYDGSARGVFSGTIIVREDAQKTNAIQQNQSILVSENASVDSKPQLKIWADDVKCTHGATVGQLDEHALFYLRSRGIGKETARNMLLHAFASEVIQHVPQESLRESLEGRLLSNLGQHLA